MLEEVCIECTQQSSLVSSPFLAVCDLSIKSQFYQLHETMFLCDHYLIMFSNIALAIVESDQWKSALRNTASLANGRKTTPTRRLIYRMPGTYMPTTG